MRIQEILKEKNMSIYKLSKMSGVPYTTVNDICNERVKLNQSSAETVYRLAQALNLSMEDLLEPYLVKRSSFENFKSTVCHRLKAEGDIAFIRHLLKSGRIQDYFSRKWYPESFYLLGMLDYLSRENNIPQCKDFNHIRQHKLEEPLYPSGILALASTSHDQSILDKAKSSAIPEFMRFNIVENEVRNVV